MFEQLYTTNETKQANQKKKMLVGRESEFNKLEALLLSALFDSEDCGASQSGGLSIYISGPPGTGKTATVRAVFDKLNTTNTHKFHFVAVDCFATPSSSALMKKLLAELGHHGSGVPACRAHNALCDVFSNTKKPVVILLDEVDKLVGSGSSKSKLLYTIFGWPTQFGGRVVIIGIANTLDLTQRQMPLLRLGSGTAQPPQLITFAAYTSEQLIAILEHRLMTTTTSVCLDRKAIELCARKVSALTGDVRRALDIASQMIANLETADNNDDDHPQQQQRDEADKENNSKQDEADVAALRAAAPSSQDVQQRTPSKCLRRTPQKVLRKGIGGGETPSTTPTASAAALLCRGRGGGEDAAGDDISSLLNNQKCHDKGGVTPKRTKFADGSACREVLKAINKTMSSPCQRSRLPAQTRTLLATLMRLVSSASSSSSSSSTTPRSLVFTAETPSKTPSSSTTFMSKFSCSSANFSSTNSLSVSRDRLFRAYLMVCERLKLAAPCADEMDEMLALLESQSMVTLVTRGTGAKGGGGNGGRTRICFTVEMGIARAQINDNALINDIEHMDDL